MNDQQLAATLLAYLREHAPLPVKAGRLNLDTLDAQNESMSLQVSGGQALRTWLDGTKIMEQPFVLFYRAPLTDNNDKKSTMLDALDGIGAWMDEIPLPYLGDWLDVTKFEQVQLANINNQEGKQITYQAGFVLGYETINSI